MEFLGFEGFTGFVEGFQRVYRFYKGLLGCGAGVQGVGVKNLGF